MDVGGAVIQLAAGSYHTCALLDTGAVRCWGDGAEGGLGYGNTSNIGDNETPISAGDVNIDGSVIQVAAGDFHTCGLPDTVVVRCWGAGDHGRLGYVTTINIGDDASPASAGNVRILDSIITSTAGVEYTCDLPDTTDAHCWSDGFSEQPAHVTTNSITDDETPASADHSDASGSILHSAVSFEYAGIQLDGGLTSYRSDATRM